MRAPHAPPAEPVRGHCLGPSPSAVAVAQAGGFGRCWLLGRGALALGKRAVSAGVVVMCCVPFVGAWAEAGARA